MKDLLKFITCGSVDDGKSTLIGHMLYDAKLIYTDQENALILDSKVGSRNGEIDYSLLLDGLMAEREQGITIDVAYRFFNTEKRSFIVADTPGHEEYTRNMAVGASFADLAIILIDAQNGVQVQTRRHTRICSLMGIHHFVFAINKMDLVGYDRQIFEEIEKDVKELVKEFTYETLSIIPVSATEGDNLNKKSENMSWYDGVTLLDYLENIDCSAQKPTDAFVMPVQRVSRPNFDFRGFQGQVVSGKISVGDEICVLPSKETANIKELYNLDKKVEKIYTGQAVTIVLDKEIDISRGCVITSKESGIEVNRLVKAQILWMDDDNLVEGRNYYFKLGTKQINATIMKINYCVDVNSGEKILPMNGKKNDILNCDIALSDKIPMTSFAKLRDLGRFVLINPVTHQTSACGVIEHTFRRSDNLTWQNLEITKEFRASMKGQKPGTYWFTGLSGSGKSTIANALEKALVSAGKHTMILDGDNVRHGLNNDLGFSDEDRIENIRRVAEVAKLMNEAGLIVLVSFISPFAMDRQKARDIIGEDFTEIYVATPLEECERRDVKGLYEKARKGEIPNFTGIGSPYEVPENPELTVNEYGDTIDASVAKILDYINKQEG